MRRSRERPPLTLFFMGYTVADVVDALERRDDLLVVRDDDDGSFEPVCHLVQIRITAIARSESSGAVGSSARITGGRLTRPRAIATRCCSPPESCDGMAPARCWHVQRDQSSRAMACFGIGYAGQHRQQGDVIGDIEERDQVGAWKTKKNQSCHGAGRAGHAPSSRCRR